jgi:eukaryotic-like serine/threonine-protein kinase
MAIPGTLVLEKYRIVRPFARGASSTVYLAFDDFGAPFAIKLFPPHLAARADREFLVGQHLQHPRINAVIDRVTIEGMPGVLMAFSHGERLNDFVESHGRRHFPTVLVHALEALDHIHSKGFVHRDFKPENLVIWQVTGGIETKLIDFDLSGPTGEVFRDPLAVGTLPYISPEGVRGQPLTAASDLYSAGVLLYWGLTSELPFTGTPQEVMRAHVEDAPPKPKLRSQSVRAHALAEIALKLLAKDPAERYASAKAVFQAITGVLKGE